MRTFLVIIDESEEATSALRYAARRAAAVGGAVHLLALVAQQNFSAFGAVQATIEAEARDRAEMLAHGVAGNLLAESGIMPTISVKIGQGRRSSANSWPSTMRSPRWCWAQPRARRRGRL